MLGTSDGIIIFSEYKSALEVIKNGNLNFSQVVNNLSNLIMEREVSCILQRITAHAGIERMSEQTL